MVLPRRLARLNRHLLNRVLVHVAPRVPGFAVLHHRGRRTGRRHAVPVNVFVHRDRYVIALTYGPGTDWLRNVRAAGRCTITSRGRVVPLGSPRVYRDPQRADVPVPVQLVLRVIGVEEFLEMRATAAREVSSSPAAGRRSPPGSR